MGHEKRAGLSSSSTGISRVFPKWAGKMDWRSVEPLSPANNGMNFYFGPNNATTLEVEAFKDGVHPHHHWFFRKYSHLGK
jgi:hypothetical protein